MVNSFIFICKGVFYANNIIYSLTCPISGEVKYIGKADDVKRRLRQHVYQSKKSDGRKSVWIRELLSEGLKPIMGVLDEVSYFDDVTVYTTQSNVIFHN